MGAHIVSAAEETRSQRIRDLARRCRELSEMTAVPELINELNSIAEDLDNEAEMALEE
jgi:hypothetical protein